MTQSGLMDAYALRRTNAETGAMLRSLVQKAGVSFDLPAPPAKPAQEAAPAAQPAPTPAEPAPASAPEPAPAGPQTIEITTRDEQGRASSFAVAGDKARTVNILARSPDGRASKFEIKEG